MTEDHDVRNLSDLFSAFTRAGTFALAVMHSQEASDIAKADASAVVDLAARRLHDLMQALDEEDED